MFKANKWDDKLICPACFERLGAGTAGVKWNMTEEVMGDTICPGCGKRFDVCAMVALGLKPGTYLKRYDPGLFLSVLSVFDDYTMQVNTFANTFGELEDDDSTLQYKAWLSNDDTIETKWFGRDRPDCDPVMIDATAETCKPMPEGVKFA